MTVPTGSCLRSLRGSLAVGGAGMLRRKGLDEGGSSVLSSDDNEGEDGQPQ